MNCSNLLNSIEYKNKFYNIEIGLSEEDTNKLFSSLCEIMGIIILENSKLKNEFLRKSNLIDNLKFIKSIKRKSTFTAEEFEKINKIFKLIERDLIKFILLSFESLGRELIQLKTNEETNKKQAYKQIKEDIFNYIKLNFNNFNTVGDIIEFITTIFNL